MQFTVLACDYDGTLAPDGIIGQQTIDSLRRCAASGRKLVMVTGRELPELLEVCSTPELFELIVAENGGMLYRPATREEKALGSASLSGVRGRRSSGAASSRYRRGMWWSPPGSRMKRWCCRRFATWDWNCR